MKIFRRGGHKRWLYVVAIVVILGAYGGWASRRALPVLVPTAPLIQLSIQSSPARLVWPTAGQSAVGLVGSSILETHGVQKPVPTASTAKLITALAVLHLKPLLPGQQGPTLTLTAADAALYDSYVAQDGSVVPVAAGEQISEYQMLEAMLLPSANNMADSLAIWAFGSLPAYTVYAQNYAHQLGLSNTHIGSDASGFAPSTTSTAGDLVRLGELVMQNPVLAQIVSQPNAGGIPVVGSVKNVNWLLGTVGIVGIKTGNTAQAGGVFISASRTTINGHQVTIVTVLAGAPSLTQALATSLPLVQSAQTNFRPVSIITTGSVVGHYALPWGGNVPVVASRPLAIPAWNGGSLPATIKLDTISLKARTNQTVGSLTVPQSALAGQQSVPLILTTAPTKPSIWWRLLNPF